jgi:hypothetical protein
MPQPFAASAIAKGWPAGNVNPWCGPLPRLAEPAASQGLRAAAGWGVGALAVREGGGRPLHSLQSLNSARPQAGPRSGLKLKAAKSGSAASAPPSAATEARRTRSPKAAHAAATALQSALAAPLLDLRRQCAVRRIRNHGARRCGSTRCGGSNRQQAAGPNHCQQSGSHSALLSGHACGLGTARPGIWGGGSRAT